MVERLGFDADASIRCADAMFRLINKRVSERLEQCRGHVAELESLVKTFKKTGVYEGPPEMKDLVSQIRNMKGKESKRAIWGFVSFWGTFALSSTLSFTPLEVAEDAGVTQDVAEAFLGMFSTRFGEVPDGYLLPEPSSRLRTHPIIQYEDKFMCPGPHLVLWAIKPQLEAELQRESALGSKSSLWDKYPKASRRVSSR
jgi:hypothetical protein